MRIPRISRCRWSRQTVNVSSLCLGAWLSLAPKFEVAPAQAQEPAEKRHVVALTVGQPTDGIDTAFANNLRAHLAELELTFSVHELPANIDLAETVAEAKRQAELAKAFLVVWIMREDEQRIVYLYDPAGPHLRARAVTVSGSTAAASEELALILRSQILARIQGGELPMPEVALPGVQQPAPQPPKALAVEQVASPALPRAPRWGASPSFIFTKPLRDERGQPGMNLRVWRRGHRFRGGIDYTLFRDFSVSSEQAAISISRHPAEAYLGYETWNTRIHSLVAELGFLADAIRRRTDSAQAPLSGQAASWRWNAALAGRLRSELRILPNLAATLGIGVELLLNPYDFQVSVATERRTIGSLAPVRWTLDLGLTLLAW